VLVAEEATATLVEPDVLEVHGLAAEQVGDLAFRNRVPIHELTPQQASLEEAFMSLTRAELEFATLGDVEQPAAGVAA
jgi:ABC-2 type transport system ATP-binding protein